MQGDIEEEIVRKTTQHSGSRAVLIFSTGGFRNEDRSRLGIAISQASHGLAGPALRNAPEPHRRKGTPPRRPRHHDLQTLATERGVHSISKNSLSLDVALHERLFFQHYEASTFAGCTYSAFTSTTSPSTYLSWWRTHAMVCARPSSSRPLGARSSHWYVLTIGSSPRA